MDDAEIKYLEKAINNENNESLSNLTFDKIERKKKEILSELDFSQEKTNKLLKKLENYRYVEEIPELQIGNYMRWINLNDLEILNDLEKLKLNNGSILCEIKIENNIILVFKNYMNKHFQINMDENLLFQKFTDQEIIILYALEHIK